MTGFRTFNICSLGAVQIKFGLTVEELALVWPPMLECIKSKRRNTKAKLKKEAPKNGKEK